MPVTIALPEQRLILPVDRLSGDVFSSFGTVIQNPAPSLIPSSALRELPQGAVQANQGTALKYLDVTVMKDLYGPFAPSRKLAAAVMNMFVCAPRPLLSSPETQLAGLFPIEILERHPYTTQTFIPLGLSPAEASEARYLVIVAPTLDPSAADECFPVPFVTGYGQSLPGRDLPTVRISDSKLDPSIPGRDIATGWAGGSSEPGPSIPGRGLPDLRKARAFVANGSQAVTYGVGTWHAPMVVIGRKPINFMVVQFANGVAIEDCQEAVFENGDKRGLGIFAAVPKIENEYDLRHKL